ncbi:serine hydrolase domain-containing protein [Methanolobus chelungpuianus]|uniref:serine hydrolase domain-containing protein n=1 Tax=Methanolobus chelungpuianus TaxID=502115 RepID=UPI0021139BF9|nr:serine hydrolase domain-containing protein [Methanolobus chelungpuianus]
MAKVRDVNHAVLAVESIDGSFRWSGAIGIAHPDGTPMRTNTPFWIASVTKLYIASAVLKLHEQGHLSIYEKMTSYLPRNLTEGLNRTKDGVDHSDKITLLHLLSHSSGIPDYLEIHQKGEKLLWNSILEDGDRSWSIEDSIQLVRNVNHPLFRPQPMDVKGRKSRYSDTNFQLLIAIIENVTGKPVHHVFEEMFCRPLNLKRTYFPSASAYKRFPIAASIWYKDQSLDLPYALESARDLISTADELIIFMRALIRGDFFDDPGTTELMQSDWNRFGLMLSPVAPGWPIEYGLGIMRFKVPPPFSFFRSFPELRGHTGVSSAWLFYCPEIDMIITGTVSQLSAVAVPFKLVPKIAGLLSRELRTGNYSDNAFFPK